MRRLVSSFVVSSLVAALFFSIGCGSAPMRSDAKYALPEAKSSPAAPPPAPAPVTATAVSQDEVYAGAEVATVDEAPNPSTGASGSSAPPSNALPPPNGPSTTASPEMFDIEARLTMKVDKLTDARAAVRKLVEQYGGTITNDELNAQSEYEQADFEIRIPSNVVYKFLDGVDGVGRVTAREVKARDVGKEYHDDLILLDNLEKEMRRYEEILAQAKDVKDMLQIEQQLSRVRGQIEQVKGTLQWLKDRVARSTVYLRLVPEKPGDTFHEPEAKLYPGLRATYLLDFRSDGSKERFAGFGLSLHFARAFSIDLDGMRGVSGTEAGNGLQAFVATMGGDFYSDYFGGGQNKWLNPYLGVRLGYARILEFNDFVTTGVVGLEILKTKTLMIDLQGRVGGFFGKEGTHVGVQPSIALNVAF